VNRRTHLTFVALIVAGLIGVGLLAIPGSPLEDEPTLGLDLQGGLEVTLQAVPPENRKLTEEDLRRSVEILRDRVDALGVSEPEIRTQGDKQIVIDLPGVSNPEDLIDIIGQTAQLELFDLEANLAPPSRQTLTGEPIPKESLYDLLSGQQALVEQDTKTTWYLFDAERKLRAGPSRDRDGLLQADVIEEAGGEKGTLPDKWRVFGVPPKTVVITCGIGEVVCPGVGVENPEQNFYYLFKYDPANADEEKRVPEMTGADLELDGTRQDFDTQRAEPIVTLQFTDKGGDKFQEITNDIADRGSGLYNLRGAGSPPEAFFQHFAIVLDRQIKSWPTIDFKQYPNGIGGTSAQITGIGDLGEAQDLALVLQSGALPVTFTTLESTTISATLGADSLEQAWQAAIAGLVVVALFLLVFYRFLGLVAVFGLAIYAAFTYAVMLLFNVTLTLPGFAGLILSIGVAADANIVIFERIKEESRAGKSVRAAIASGYKKGFATIVDANVVTALAAMVLFTVATAGVKGFAFLLLLGTGISILTAVLATRAFLGLLGGFAWFDNPRFMGASAREIPWWQRIDIVGKRRIWFAIAGALIVLSLGSIVIKGLNLGIDFEGGTNLTFTTAQPEQLADVREAAAEIGREDADIFGLGEKASNGGYTEFSFRSEPLDPAEQKTLLTALEREFDAASAGVRNVSASFSEQILRGAILALIVSFLLITIYISFRFEWRFAVPILRTIVNDGLIALGVYSISGREVSAETVAAFLTIIGYSIYDTIIIFDRVRENIPLMRRSSIARIINVSLWETIPRSLATTFITLLPVSALFFFGGETLKDFAFAILVGISISAFSTIFIAAPFLAVLKEREPEFARRKAQVGPAEESVGGLREAEALAAAQPDPDLIPDDLEPAPAVIGADEPSTDGAPKDGAASKRDRRRQRRASRPHGRAR
jgi:SecD/SecF fusion protein